MRAGALMVLGSVSVAGLNVALGKEFNEKNQRSAELLYIAPGFALMHS